MENKVAIIIVSYNACSFMQDNIESIRKTLDTDYRIIVVDNASADGVSEWLIEQEKSYDDISVILNNENLGFSKACNQGVQATVGTEFEDADIFLLNNDTRLSRNTVQNLMTALYSSDDIGAVSPTTNYGGNNQQIDVSFSLPYKYVEYGNKISVNDSDYKKIIKEVNDEYGIQNTVFFDAVYEEKVRLYGFAIIIKRFLWDEIGGMDEDFTPGYFEDDALSMEIAKRGYRQILCKNSFVYHAGSQSFSKVSGTEELLLNHYELFIAKYGFPILDFCDVNDYMMSNIPYKYDDEFALIHIGCGLGAELKYIRSYYKNAIVIGVEEDASKRNIAQQIDAVYESLPALYKDVSNKVFDVVCVSKDTLGKMTDTDFEIIDKICKDTCAIISDEKNETETEQVNLAEEQKDCEMSTEKILSAIYKHLSSSITAYKNIDFEDVRELLKEDLKHRIGIYDFNHLIRIINAFDTKIDDIKKAQINNDDKKINDLFKQLLDSYTYVPDVDHSIELINKSSFNQEALRHYRDNTTIIIGDSHVNFFSGNEHLRFYPIGNDINYCPVVNNFPFTVLHLGPCLAYTCRNDETTYKFKEKINYLKKEFIKPGSRLIIALGEIDIRAHVFKQVIRQGVSYNKVVDDILYRYEEEICELRNEGYEVIVYGPIASQPDSCELDELFPRVGSEEDRNKATIYFNNSLRQYCDDMGIKFITMSDLMINDKFKTNQEYLSDDKCHLGQHGVQDLIIKLKHCGILEDSFIYEIFEEKLNPEDRKNKKQNIPPDSRAYVDNSLSEPCKYDALIMAVPSDYLRLEHLYGKLLDTMPVRRICFVGNEEVGRLVSESGYGDRLGFINENEILSFDEVHNVMKDALSVRLNGQELPRGVTGWYYQQFLKMKYSSICKDDYYLVWDGDTVPCAPFSMFREGTSIPYFDLKTEYHEEYFVTLSKLLPGMGKVIKKSFISEHMLMRKEIMQELISEIERNESLKGTKFYEKIIYSIPPEKLTSNSFSEFETYGTYTALKHMDAYRLRDWHSFRYGGDFFDSKKIGDEDFKWLSVDFNAISFEKGHEVRDDHKNLFDNKEYQEKLTARQMLEIAQEEFKGDSFIESWD